MCANISDIAGGKCVHLLCIRVGVDFITPLSSPLLLPCPPPPPPPLSSLHPLILPPPSPLSSPSSSLVLPSPPRPPFTPSSSPLLLLCPSFSPSSYRTFGPLWSVLKVMCEKLISIHTQFVKILSELAKEITDYNHTQKEKMKSNVSHVIIL